LLLRFPLLFLATTVIPISSRCHRRCCFARDDAAALWDDAPHAGRVARRAWHPPAASVPGCLFPTYTSTSTSIIITTIITATAPFFFFFFCSYFF
jgi:hypothetical protein